MKSTTHFNNTKPSMRTEVVADGYEYITTTVDAATLNLKKLNTWLKDLPGLIAKNGVPVDDKRLSAAVYHYKRSTDSFTAALVENAEALQKVIDTIDNLHKHGNNTPIQSE
jgi:hypothetical protein